MCAQLIVSFVKRYETKISEKLMNYLSFWCIAASPVYYNFMIVVCYRTFCVYTKNI